jgi:L-ascorbate metabolism protein UlaG (beta-lactamase superfamily)
MKPNNNGIKITWFGHSAFLFESHRGKNILIDPWLDNPKAPAGAKDIANVDLILITHGHSDHIGNSIEIAKRTNAKIISIFEISLYISEHGITNTQGMNKGGTVDIDGVKVTMVDAKHSSGIDYDGRLIEGGEPAGYVIEFENGFRIYHAGDTALFGDMKLIGEFYKPDLVILPIGGLYTMGPEEAAYACRLLMPKYIIGMHYGTFPALTGTPNELLKLLPLALKDSVVELEVGQQITF